MAFLKDEDFEDVPEDDGDAFVKLADICRQRLMSRPADRDGDLFFEDVVGYMNEVAALAEHYGIPDVSYDRDFSNNVNAEFATFTRAVEYRAVQIRAQRARRKRRNSVALSGPGRERLQHYLEKLKIEVIEANIPERRKRALLDRIADFEAELSKSRFNMAVAFSVVALVVATVNDTGGAVEHLSKLAHSITKVFGDEKAHEEEQQRQLPAREPFRAIPDMNKGKRDQDNVDLASADDDIPF